MFRDRVRLSFLLACVVTLGFLASSLAAGNPSVARSQKLYFDPCPGFGPDHPWDHYHDYSEVTAFVQAAAAAHPEATLESIGESWQGRDIWVLTITDRSTGAPEDKPGIWVDGGIDADEVVGVEVALYVIWELLVDPDGGRGDDIKNRTFYIAPDVIPDSTELQMTTPQRPRDVTQRPWDDDRDGLIDEDPPEDLNGDNYITQMRKLDPDGQWVISEEDARVMRRRALGDEGPFYSTYQEGIDNDGDGRLNEDPTGGVDPNRNYPANWAPANVQGGAGPWPASELEVRAMIEFFYEHPNIAASQHLHSTGGVILRPPTVPGVDMPESDLQVFMEISYAGLEATGYALATPVIDWNWPSGTPNTKPGQVWRDNDGEIRGFERGGGRGGFAAVPVDPAGDRSRALRAAAADPANRAPRQAGVSDYPAYGGSLDTLYEMFGAVAFANEIYRMGEDYDENGSISVVERLRYNDEVLGGQAFSEWTSFNHPEFEEVEIGGWRKFGQNNPLPPDYLPELQKNTAFVHVQADAVQMLDIDSVEVEAMGNGVYRVTVPVRNEGFVPTELAVRVQRRQSVPVRVTLNAPAGATLLYPEKAVAEIEVIPGYDKREVWWLLLAPEGGEVSVVARHPKAGVAEGTARLR